MVALARGAVLSTVTRSVLSLSGCDNGGDMAGGRKLSAPVKSMVRGCVRQQEERGKTVGLTGGRKRRSAGSGTRQTSRIAGGDRRRPRWKTSSKASPRCSWGRDLPRGGALRHHGAFGHGKGARGPRWSRWQRTAATSSARVGREGEGGEAGREGSGRGGPRVCVASPGASGQRWEAGGGTARVRARRPHALVLLAQGGGRLAWPDGPTGLHR